jgi:MFS family permease
MALVLATFFLASAGASSAYLTVSEIFPMETRALAISLFFALGTAAGGIAGPVLFGQFIHSGNADLVATGFFIGAVAMAVGGVAELRFGVRAEQQALEGIAKPLTAEEAEAALSGAEDRAPVAPARPGVGSGSRFYSPGMVGSTGAASRTAAMADADLEREVEAIVAVLVASGPISADELANRVQARYWGPGRFRAALRTAVDDGDARRASRTRYGPPQPPTPAAG